MMNPASWLFRTRDWNKLYPEEFQEIVVMLDWWRMELDQMIDI